MNSSVLIAITAKTSPVDSQAPSHLEGGCGDDKVWFQVSQPPFPSWALVNHLLGLHCSDWILNSYCQETGTGVFTSVDLEGPGLNELIDVSSSVPIPENRVVLVVYEPEQR